LPLPPITTLEASRKGQLYPKNPGSVISSGQGKSRYSNNLQKSHRGGCRVQSGTRQAAGGGNVGVMPAPTFVVKTTVSRWSAGESNRRVLLPAERVGWYLVCRPP